MPAFLINIIISLAVRFGLPWILKKFPGIPDKIKAIIEELILGLAEKKQEKKALVQVAQAKVHAVCTGQDCKI